jgi:uncharacterized protein YjeT (DUF2065 family)
VNDLLVAFGLVLVIEGVAYALLAPKLKELAVKLSAAPDSALRFGGLIAAVVGVLIVFLVRG